ncbi:cobalamin-binding protein [candidate division WOR-3 bacterium JGI_Cruoil_03_44_89]|uniref:Cobalamin-binding protein n=1 Tax=candidate division WOR-3 bacterium JGI_Cruoil_03_44_89 TaxID=1973748 RepID=A0A235BPJ6_UNCW3|nr:MAG: cobalamin-binding protein [candidate division WOR-3 bacterium JGI_Cruoil_03_44_89]OYD16473.1 MAG: cobalamin-binding protein [candidate division WOR-3 bacterium JGI_Cruoil_03_44_89]
MDILKQISENLRGGNDKKVLEFTKLAIEQKIPPKDILDDGLIAGMDTVGKLFKAHEIFLPDVLLAAKAMYSGMDELKPILIREGIPTIGKVVIGTIQGDLHDIGKNLVGIMLKGAGFEVIDLGNDVSPEKFVERAKKENAKVIGMSALLTTTMQGMRKVIDLLNERGLSGEIKTIIGGAPVSEEFAREIGADAYGYDAASAVDRVKKLTREK